MTYSDWKCILAIVWIVGFVRLRGTKKCHRFKINPEKADIYVNN